jgi:hypothetical protein
LGGVSRQYIIHPTAKRAARDSVWKQGAAAVHTTAESVASKKRLLVKPATLKTKPFVKFEDIAIRILASNRKYQKYQRDRQAFFEDSRSKLIKYWYQWLG